MIGKVALHHRNMKTQPSPLVEEWLAFVANGGIFLPDQSEIKLSLEWAKSKLRQFEHLDKVSEILCQIKLIREKGIVSSLDLLGLFLRVSGALTLIEMQDENRLTESPLFRGRIKLRVANFKQAFAESKLFFILPTAKSFGFRQFNEILPYPIALAGLTGKTIMVDSEEKDPPLFLYA